MTLPHYTLRVSKKAKYLQLRLSSRGLEVVVPAKQRLNNNKIEEFVLQKRNWIERQRKFYAPHALDTCPQPLPSSIHLHAIDQLWKVVYAPTVEKKVTLIANLSRQITIMGDVSNEEECLKKLRQWLKEVAYDYLSEQLRLLSRETGLSFTSMTIRNNTSRWGSCSSEGKISLCCKLLFLPPVLMRHILLHELCHTKVMNHGVRFWRLLEKMDEKAKEHAKQLKIAATQVPGWILPSF